MPPLPALRPAHPGECQLIPMESEMSAVSPAKTISVRIDGELVTAKEAQTILGLSAVGACRVCVVELAGTDRLLPACTTPIQEGMSIKTSSAKLTLYRRMAVELLLVERNHICSSCVSNGHCELQSLASSLGITHVRFTYNNPRLAVDMTHPRFVLDHNRCILCTRCVRVWAMRATAPAAANACRPAPPERSPKRASRSTKWSNRAMPSAASPCKNRPRRTAQSNS